MNSKTIINDSRKIILTFAIALSTGWLFLQGGLPAPFLMGSLFGVWVIGANVKKLQPHLGVARWFHIPVVLGLGVLIGSHFTADIWHHAFAWSDTLLAMVIVTIIVTLCGYLFLTKIRQYDHLTAFLCSVPGGQAEVLVMAREHVEKDYVVALFHLIRVAFVFFSTPLLLAFIQGAEAVNQSNQQLASMPSLIDLSLVELGYFLGLGIIGYAIARQVRLPMAHLLGPVILSTIAHAAGLVHIPRIFEFVMLAQLAIGGAVGARLAQVKFAELLYYLRDAIANTTMILCLYFIAAMIMVQIAGLDLLALWLAFVPGGLYEVTLLALIFGFDIAFVAFHHTVRIILIFISMPFAARSLQKHRQKSE